VVDAEGSLAYQFNLFEGHGVLGLHRYEPTLSRVEHDAESIPREFVEKASGAVTAEVVAGLMGDGFEEAILEPSGMHPGDTPFLSLGIEPIKLVHVDGDRVHLDRARSQEGF
jgi:hypothetical protein